MPTIRAHLEVTSRTGGGKNGDRMNVCRGPVLGSGQRCDQITGGFRTSIIRRKEPNKNLTYPESPGKFVGPNWRERISAACTLVFGSPRNLPQGLGPSTRRPNPGAQPPSCSPCTFSSLPSRYEGKRRLTQCSGLIHQSERKRGRREEAGGGRREAEFLGSPQPSVGRAAAECPSPRALIAVASCLSPPACVRTSECSGSARWGS